MSDHIVELEHMLQQNREEDSNRYIARTAKIQRRDNKIEELLKDAWSPKEVSNTLRVPLVTVERKAAELRRVQEEVARYMCTGGLPEGEDGYFGIIGP